MGSLTTQGRPATRACAAGRVAFHRGGQCRRPDCKFSKLNTQPILSPVYASPDTSRRPAQNSGPSGSLLLSREALSSSTLCRFLSRRTHHIFFPPRLEVVAQKQNPDGFASYTWNQLRFTACSATSRTVHRAWPSGCLASTTFTHQRELFLPINDNYNLDELPMA
jgi:hypothetical protein